VNTELTNVGQSDYIVTSANCIYTLICYYILICCIYLLYECIYMFVLSIVSYDAKHHCFDAVEKNNIFVRMYTNIGIELQSTTIVYRSRDVVRILVWGG